MKTDELKITQSPQEMENTLDKIELIALYTGMSRKEATSMRLLAEELLTATRSILLVAEGCLWMETDEERFTLHLRVTRPEHTAERKKLVALSKSGKATPPKGLFTRLGAALQDILLSNENTDMMVLFTSYSMYSSPMFQMGDMYAYHYLPPQNQPEDKPKDELAGIEKSIIDAIVDDILVSVGLNYVEITAIKNLQSAKTC